MPKRHSVSDAVDRELRLRPSERVMQYLLAEFDRPDLREGSRLPTIRELAARLKVSIFTVQQVFNKLSQQGRIRTEVGNGTFLVSNRTGKHGRLTVAVGIPTPSNTPYEEWHHRIYGGMMNAVASADRSISLHPLPQMPQDSEAMSDRLLSECSQVDGLILFPCVHAGEIQAAYEREGRFIVHANPPSATATANFVSPDYLGASRQLAETWRQTGRRRVLLLLTAVRDSVSRRLRIAGVASGLDAELGRAVSLRIVEAGGALEPSGHEASGYEAMRQSLREDPARPDAVYCEGDFLAVGALRALREAGLRIPVDVSVAAGTGLNVTETLYPQLTRTQHPLEKMGEGLIAMLLERIRRQGAHVSAVLLPTPFIGGATTRPEENERLQVGRLQPLPREDTRRPSSTQPPPFP